METRSKKEDFSKLKIIPIKDDEDQEGKTRKKELHPNLPDVYQGQLLSLVAPIRSSKSTTWNNLILSDNFFNDMFQDVHVISNTIASDKTSRFAYKKFRHTCHDLYNDSIIRGIITRQKAKMKNKEEDCSFALILDDLLNQFPKNGKKGMEAIAFASRFRHYSNGDPCMLLYSTQRYYDLNKIVRNNSTGIMFSGNIKSRKEWEQISDDFADVVGGKEHFDDMIKEVQKEPYQWLYLKLDTTPPRAYKNFTTQLFPVV